MGSVHRIDGRIASEIVREKDDVLQCQWEIWKSLQSALSVLGRPNFDDTCNGLVYPSFESRVLVKGAWPVSCIFHVVGLLKPECVESATSALRELAALPTDTGNVVVLKSARQRFLDTLASAVTSYVVDVTPEGKESDAYTFDRPMPFVDGEAVCDEVYEAGAAAVREAGAAVAWADQDFMQRVVRSLMNLRMVC